MKERNRFQTPFISDAAQLQLLDRFEQMLFKVKYRSNSRYSIKWGVLSEAQWYNISQVWNSAVFSGNKCWVDREVLKLLFLLLTVSPFPTINLITMSQYCSWFFSIIIWQGWASQSCMSSFLCYFYNNSASVSCFKGTVHVYKSN